MVDSQQTHEHLNILQVLAEAPNLRLREIHDELAQMENSEFSYSPEFGDGWNEERRSVKELRDELSNVGLVNNDYQTWSITAAGKNRISL